MSLDISAQAGHRSCNSVGSHGLPFTDYWFGTMANSEASFAGFWSAAIYPAIGDDYKRLLTTTPKRIAEKAKEKKEKKGKKDKKEDTDKEKKGEEGG